MVKGWTPKYLERTESTRDRFQVEYNEEERKLILQGIELLQQAKDATVIKQLAFLGLYAISSHDQFMRYYNNTLFINERNNRRVGINIENEINNKIQQLRSKTGWKL